MPRSVSFRPLARADVDNAISWYGDKRPALALAFAESLDAVIARIRETPMQFPIVRGEIRRALLGRFPYGVFFTITDHQIEVLAVLHLHSKPATWKDRG
jgi:plasmid stabilization system protein ParE